MKATRTLPTDTGNPEMVPTVTLAVLENAG